MEILGIGPSELFFIIIIALIILGPKDMQKAGKTIGRWLNDLVRSDGWKAFQQTSKEIRNLPTKLMRDANMELAETQKELNKALDDSLRLASSRDRDPSVEPRAGLSRPQQAENSAQSEPASADPTDQSIDTNEKTS